jgi:hypothetical protein
MRTKIFTPGPQHTAQPQPTPPMRRKIAKTTGGGLRSKQR